MTKCACNRKKSQRKTTRNSPQTILRLWDKSPHKTAIIIGVTGQDGSYLAEHLRNEGYEVLGVKRRSSTDTTERLRSLMDTCTMFQVIEGDVTDYASMSNVFQYATEQFGGAPHEVYNLAAQTHVGTSFKQPLATWDSTAQGVVNILEVMRQGNYIHTTKFYQASTSEMFGDNYKLVTEESPSVVSVDGACVKQQPKEILVQDESLSFHPRSPYAVAKTAAHQMVGLYREAYGLFGCCGILFNHESPRRGDNFVTRKITKYVAELYFALRDSEKRRCMPKLVLGNLSASRDWGHARDYVRAMHAMMQCDRPDDYVVATGETHSVKEFCQVAFKLIEQDYKKWVDVDPQFFRPAEVPHLCGVAEKAKRAFGWEPQVTFRELVTDMVRSDISLLRGCNCESC